MKAYLILEDGHVFTGNSIGSTREVISEIVFNTSMTGYLEVLTDPSYQGQAVMMTYPLIGNYGVCEADMESEKPYMKGFIIRELSRVSSNFRSEESLLSFIEKYEITGIEGIDTRMLTRILRESGTMNGVITTNANFNIEELKERMSVNTTADAVKCVTCKQSFTKTPEQFELNGVELAKTTYMASEALKEAIGLAKEAKIPEGPIMKAAVRGVEGIELLTRYANGAVLVPRYRIALLDFGHKRNIVRSLLRCGCEVTVYPAETKASDILAAKPDGIMLSNGPGDPEDCAAILPEIKVLFDSGVPLMAICLGHQLVALANGFQTRKMTYGHRGVNHPVKDVKTGMVYMSSQNHGYVVKTGTVRPEIASVRYINANDQTVEGIDYIGKPVFTVQFHPEVCAGPQDSEFLFDQFMDMITENKRA